MRTTIGEFLLRRLKEVGVSEVIGVPGDFNLNWLEQIEAFDGVRFVGTCNELNAAYAVDGYARQRRLGALLTTYGVGELSALNGVAGAAAEHVPFISVAGAPPLFAIEYRYLVHHSLAEGNFDNMLAAFRPFTAAAVRLTPANAVVEIDRVISLAVRESLPVHIQVPSDITHLEVDVPDTPLDPELPTSDERRLADAVDATVAKLKDAKAPLVLVDQDAARHEFQQDLLTFVETTGVNYSQLPSGKAILPERHPQFIGTYNGKASAPGVQDRVETADFLLTTTPRFIEVNSGGFTHDLPEASVVNVGDQHVAVGGEFYVGINTREFFARLNEAVANLGKVAGDGEAKEEAQSAALPEVAEDFGGDKPLTHERIWNRFGAFIKEGDVVVAEAGTSNIGLGTQRFPDGVTYINSPIWGSIGFTLPATLGSMLAAEDRRHVLFIGDGSFQLTAQELSTMLRQDQKPIIVLLNNRGYTIERYILGMDREYNDIANWDYAGLPKVFDAETTMEALQARTEGELEDALAAIEKLDGEKGVFLEIHMDPEDAPAGLRAFGPQTADFDYGPLGPRNP
ncbi:alpha-keto acid decarboxylase family protein [Corynebacterium incognita]|uniref:Alpha-keto-acid decarboxylase n=1 Tax=Corynebacterium incognita TaxID=2754725 RepID=A0A7G7CN93_9CORY|nr:thiamine pyrophosphate-binding protein [Corynebacterium incognita]QNE89059.1 alpha-keto acid decarboxylase family protein [Corynebacterium incognita]